MAPRLLVLSHHDRLLDVWRSEGRTGLRVAHLDAHCDMRGLVVDRARGEAALVEHRSARPSNFLAIAAAEGRVASVRWVHDRRGGRRNDTFTVLFPEDMTCWPASRRLASYAQARRFPFELRVEPLSSFRGVHPDEVLDVDWDLFFAPGKPPAAGERETRALLDLAWDPPPAEIALCSSPEYSNSRGFDTFVHALAERVGALVETVPDATPRASRVPGVWRHAARAAFAAARNAVVALQGGSFE